MNEFMTGFRPKFTITNRMTSAITQIERARGFLEAARLSDDWVRDMGNQALIKEAHNPHGRDTADPGSGQTPVER